MATLVTVLIAAQLFTAQPIAAQPIAAQPNAFLSAPIPLTQNQIVVLDTATDTYRGGTRFNEFVGGFNALAMSDRSDLLFLSPTSLPGLQVIALGPPVRQVVVSLPTEPIWLDALPDGSKAYVAHQVGLEVVDIERRQSHALLQEVAGKVQGVAVNHAGDRLYVAVSGNPSRLSVFDTTTDRETDRWQLPLASDSLQGVVVHPDDSTIYVADFRGDALIVVDAQTGRTSALVALGGAARTPTLTPLGDRLFVATNEGIAVVDTASLEMIDTLETASIPSAVDVHPDGSRLYALDSSAELSIFDVDTLALIKTLPARFTEPFLSREFIAPLDP